MKSAKLYLTLLWIVTCSVFTTLYILSLYNENGVKTYQVVLKGREETIIDSCCPNITSKTDKDIASYTRIASAQNSTELVRLQWKQKLFQEKPCKVDPSNLIGRFNLTKSVTVEEVTREKVANKIKPGGVYRPHDCKSVGTVAIIIPYRERQTHLGITINLLHNLLQRQRREYGIYVVEMNYPVQFNRGLLANAGFLTARSIGNYSCYIIHDVDLVPMNDRNLYTCGPNPVHLVTSNTNWKNGLPYSDYVGGVIALTADQYEQINGFSNIYFGWGGEDDDLFKRIRENNMTIDRPLNHIGVYMALPHRDDSTNPANPYRELLVSQATNRMGRDGLNSMKYHRKALEFRPLYTWVLVECVESEVMENYIHLRADSDLMVKRRDMKKPETVIQPGDGRVYKFRHVKN
ncbi:beta-1,4-galactosyltransferase 4-like [Mya arenaria]|uniref:beta-1,4-galactosyltransferase 4-like n=1 Tax=Mya arenaria TaxID=6604 RepID=UPI0022E711EA|nr:beta-1,4-galactosyltransferase 4-like [Mya arenaria]